MATLTGDDRKKIEEKRRQALEKLHRKRKQDHEVESSNPKRCAAFSSSAAKEFKKGSDLESNNPKRCIESSSSVVKEFKKPLSAVFTLVSPNQFTVEVSYDKELIELFKGIPSRQYNSEKRVWSFGLQHYSLLVKQVQTVLPHVRIDQIPKPILNLFLNDEKPVGSANMTDSIRTRIPDSLYSALMQFQREGVEFCVSRSGRALIADDMGLGKTVQAIAVACYYRSEWPLLVVCPASVKMAWAEAFKQWIPGLLSDEINIVMTAKPFSRGANINIISYDMLVKVSKAAGDINFRVLIADECHFLKNYKTLRAKMALPLIKKAKRAILLSGTPALSRPIELYTQITSLDSSFRIKLTDFGLRYCNGAQTNFGWDFSGASNMLELQLYLERKVMIRRMKRDVLSQLPPKRRQMVILDPQLAKVNRRDAEFAKQLHEVSKITNSMKQKDALLPLFSKTGNIKLPAVRQYILDLLEGAGRKLLVFAHHKVMMDGICQCLDEKKYRYIRIDGTTPSEVRSKYCDAFQHESKCLVAVLSITAANTGITLTASSTVVFAELFWNPGVLAQAEDRVYRIGQDAAVNIHYLVAKETVDDYLWPLINNKIDVLSKAGLTCYDLKTSDAVLLGTKEEDRAPARIDQYFEPQQETELEKNSEVDDNWFSSLGDDDLAILENAT